MIMHVVKIVSVVGLIAINSFAFSNNNRYLSGIQSRESVISKRQIWLKSNMGEDRERSECDGRVVPLRIISSKLLGIRGGNTKSFLSVFQNKLIPIFSLSGSNPEALYNTFFIALCSISAFGKFLIPMISRAFNSLSNKASSDVDKSTQGKSKSVLSLQIRFLAVFWLMRMADWLQGPYFYEVYSSKTINGLPVSLDLVSKLFLVGFATTGIFGPFLGKFLDSNGRKKGTLAYAVLYALGALSTRSSALSVLLLGRVCGGLGTSLLFSAPESWLVGEYQKSGFDMSAPWLGQTFSWAYAGDALVAMAAGQIASMSASRSGPTGPFTTSTIFLALGSLIALLAWKENVAVVNPTPAVPALAEDSDKNININGDDQVEKKKSNIGDAFNVMKADKRIMLVGAVQAFFEGAMYIFVLQWPPAMKAAIQATLGAGGAVPYGKIFSCFMACCLLGSSTFGALQSKGVMTELIVSTFLVLATVAMAFASFVTGGVGFGSLNLAVLTAAFFVFETCVGLYFPSIGTLRSKYIPDSHRSVIMNIFGIPLNLIVVSVFLSIRSLGVRGALACSGISLGIASACSVALLALKLSPPRQQTQEKIIAE